MAKKLTHLDAEGRARMVDVGAKEPSRRSARAEGVIRMAPETLAMITEGRHRKGDVLGVARVAAIMAAKRAPELAPLCHPIMLTGIEVALDPLPDDAVVRCSVTVTTHERTGVEIEALCAVQVGLLTVYDMCKAVDRGMTIERVGLVEKRGGASGDWQRDGED